MKEKFEQDMQDIWELLMSEKDLVQVSTVH